MFWGLWEPLRNYWSTDHFDKKFISPTTQIKTRENLGFHVKKLYFMAFGIYSSVY